VKTVRTILLIDDSDDDEFLTRRALKKAGVGCNLLRVCDGQDAIDYFGRTGRYADRQVFPDTELVLLDIHMPRISGFEVLQWLQDHPIEPAPFVVVMLSSSQESRDRAKALALGAQGHCAKPPGAELFEALAKDHQMQWLGPG
jgi:CheY-like chemotaxis protein